MEKNLKNNIYIYIYIYIHTYIYIKLNHFAVCQKLTQHCKSTILQFLKMFLKKEIGSFVEMWMDLESVIQSEISLKEKSKYHILTYICGI